jgi:hypothetical protein
MHCHQKYAVIPKQISLSQPWLVITRTQPTLRKFQTQKKADKSCCWKVWYPINSIYSVTS